MEENTTDHKISSLKERYHGITFSVLYKSPNGGLVERFNQGVQGKKEKYKNIEVLKILADSGRFKITRRQIEVYSVCLPEGCGLIETRSLVPHHSK